MAPAVKISKPGYSVHDTQNHLIFNSDNPLLKIHKQGSDLVSVTGSEVKSYTIFHDVGKIPMYFIRSQYMINSNNKSEILDNVPSFTLLFFGLYGFIVAKPFVDRIIIYWSYPDISTTSFKFDYFIFEDPIIE